MQLCLTVPASHFFPNVSQILVVLSRGRTRYIRHSNPVYRSMQKAPVTPGLLRWVASRLRFLFGLDRLEYEGQSLQPLVAQVGVHADERRG